MGGQLGLELENLNHHHVGQVHRRYQVNDNCPLYPSIWYGLSTSSAERTGSLLLRLNAHASPTSPPLSTSFSANRLRSSDCVKMVAVPPCPVHASVLLSHQLATSPAGTKLSCRVYDGRTQLLYLRLEESLITRVPPSTLDTHASLGRPFKVSIGRPVIQNPNARREKCRYKYSEPCKFRTLCDPPPLTLHKSFENPTRKPHLMTIIYTYPPHS